MKTGFSFLGQLFLLECRWWSRTDWQVRIHLHACWIYPQSLTSVSHSPLSPLSYPAVNRYSSSSLSSQASNEVSNITGQSESSDEVFNMQVTYSSSWHDYYEFLAFIYYHFWVNYPFKNTTYQIFGVYFAAQSVYLKSQLQSFWFTQCEQLSTLEQQRWVMSIDYKQSAAQSKRCLQLPASF